jgi:tRNA-Thr(GGU) m(6)t(6)A37 methyltransferase TsaA
MHENDLRPGEVATVLPAQFDAQLVFIGRILTPWNSRADCPKNGRESDEPCTVVVDDPWTEALRGVESCTHLILLYWMHLARRDLVLQAPQHYADGPRGTFSLRSPVRPNPIALSVTRLIRRTGQQLTVVGLDCLTDTPLLDIKPYFASTDAVPEAVVRWHAQRQR